jgi:hypothetical protein
VLLADPDHDDDHDDARRFVIAAFGQVDLWDAEDLAAHLALPRAAVAQVLDELARDGILRRHPEGYAVVGAEIA